MPNTRQNYGRRRKLERLSNRLHIGGVIELHRWRIGVRDLQRTQEGDFRVSTILRLKEAAEYLRCHPSTIYRMLKRHELAGFRVGADWRFSQEALDQWVTEQTAKQQNGASNE